MTDPKRFSSLQAHAALLGVELRAVRNDAERWTCYATAGALTIELQTPEDVERWLDWLATATEAQSAA